MALDVDTREPLRRPGELVGLLQAILDGNPNDETNWLEWKSALDLTSAAGRFHVAKGVLGLANRMPVPAASSCGGAGYLVVGVEPGNLTGVAAVDPAQLDDGLSPYLGGARGPSWGATYVELEGASVLIVSVEPPKVGDTIFTLRKTYKNHSAGTVFVRRNGKTTPADDHDMDLLQIRLRTPSTEALELNVDVVGDVPLSWFDLSTVEPAIQEWIEERRLALISGAERTERSRSGRGPAADDPFSASQRLAVSIEELSRLSNPLVKQDDRTLEDYIAEVEAWAERLAETGEESWPARYLQRGNGVIRLAVVNPTDRNLLDVMVEATFPGEELVGLDEPPYVDRLPSPPREYGVPERLDIGLSSIPVALGDVPVSSVIPPMKSTWVEDGSLRIGWAVGDLRPRESDESDDVYVFVRGPLANSSLKGVWEATSKSTDGVLAGELSVPLAEKPVQVISLFEPPDDD